MKWRILFVCGGNTCRSPMAKVILEQKLAELGWTDRFEVDSSAYDAPTLPTATKEAREAITTLYGQDILASHKSKKLTAELAQQADLILVMSARMKEGLPVDKTYTLKGFAGTDGDIPDPYGGDVNVYLKAANAISGTIDKIIPKLLISPR